MGLSAPLGGTECQGEGSRQWRTVQAADKARLLSVAALSPKPEVQPQNGGNRPRTFEPGRHRPLHTCLWEFDLKPYLLLPKALAT